MCFLAKNMYNVGLYNVRQYFFNEKKYLNYDFNYHISKVNENYKMLNSNVAQQILMEVDGAMNSFFELIELAKIGEYNYKDIKLPKYLKKDSFFTIIIGQIRINLMVH